MNPFKIYYYAIVLWQNKKKMDVKIKKTNYRKKNLFFRSI